jgi:nucleotide-binding universal stress UspA family protein
MFKRILVPLDGSAMAEQALPHAAAMAQAFDARIVLIRVLEPAGREEQLLPADPLDWEMQRAEAQSYLDRIAGKLREDGPEVAAALLEGQPAERIIDQAGGAEADLILLASHGRSGLNGTTLGSVVQKVIHRARTSIMIARSYHREPRDVAAVRYREIVVPLDGSRRAEVVLPAVSTLARRFDSRVRLVHVVRRPEFPQAEPGAAPYQELSEQVTALGWQESTKYLDKVRAWLPAESAADLLVSADVAEALQEAAEEEGADLVVLSAHGHSECTRRAYGSITTSFIMYGSAPLLIVQDLEPQSFQPTLAEIAAREHKGH